MLTEAEVIAKYKTLHDEFSEAYYGGTSGLSKAEFDLQHGKIWSDMEAELIAEGYLTPPLPPLCTHWARVDGFYPTEEKPMRVRRTWKGKEYSVNCYVTKSVKDQYLVGDIAVGDFVLVEFLEDDVDKAVVTTKVFKSW